MKRFEYRLERIRAWRKEQVELEELRLQQLQTQLNQLELDHQKLLEERDQAERSANPTSPQEMMQLPLFRRHIQIRVDAAWRLIQEHKGKLEKQRQRVIEARRHFELLERLRQKALEDWNASYSKEQEELAAELYLAKYIRDL